MGENFTVTLTSTQVQALQLVLDMAKQRSAAELAMAQAMHKRFSDGPYIPSDEYLLGKDACDQVEDFIVNELEIE
jgi:hypothetical protein